MTASDPSILMVTRENAADRLYGLGRSVSSIVAELSGRGWRVRYLCQADLPRSHAQRRDLWVDRLLRCPGVKHRPDLRNLLYAWIERLNMGWYAAEVTRMGEYSRVHLHDPWIALGFLLGAKRHRLSGVRWGVTEHGFGSYSRATREDGLIQGSLTNKLLTWIESRLLAASDWVVAPTRLALDQLALDLSMSRYPGNWQVIPHPRPCVTQVSRSIARQRLGWKDGALYVLGVGRLVPLKRFDVLLQACLQLAESYPQLHLCLLGEGDARRLLDLAEEHGFDDRLLITVTDDVGPYMAGADVYASLSASESFGLANLEALSAGLPSICSSAGAVSEVVGDGAYLIEGQLDEAVDAIGSFLASPELRKVWSARARQRAAQWPSAREVGDAYVALYQD